MCGGLWSQTRYPTSENSMRNERSRPERGHPTSRMHATLDAPQMSAREVRSTRRVVLVRRRGRAYARSGAGTVGSAAGQRYMQAHLTRRGAIRRRGHGVGLGAGSRGPGVGRIGAQRAFAERKAKGQAGYSVLHPEHGNAPLGRNDAQSQHICHLVTVRQCKG